MDAPRSPARPRRLKRARELDAGLVLERLAAGRPTRRRLPGGGRLHVERALPYLVVQRPRGREGEREDARLATTEASHLLAPAGRRAESEALRGLAGGLARGLAGATGACLLLELWTRPQREEESGTPGFTVVVAPGERALGDAIARPLARITLGGAPARVRVSTRRRPAPAGLPLLLAPEDAAAAGVTLAGLEIEACHRGSAGELFPLVLRELRRRLARALRQGLYAFARRHSEEPPLSFQLLGRRAMTRNAWLADRRLAEVAGRLDFLLLVTPLNFHEAQEEFRRARYRGAPSFAYRPLPIDPIVLARASWAAPVERVEDPAMSQLLRDKQEELARQIALLADRGSERFLHGSAQLFGGLDAELVATARRILEAVPRRRRLPAGDRFIDGPAFAALAEEEIARYRELEPGFDARVEVRDDVVSGLMVSRGRLLVGRRSRIRLLRARALIEHEVGTHLVTWFNGREQPLRLLASGLSGYDELQEGLAVLAEHLVGGLGRERLRLLAARVLGASLMLEGRDFAEVYAALREEAGLSGEVAFTVAVRLFRGGGLTKDAVYLRGLLAVLRLVRRGVGLERLYVGKIGLAHRGLVHELTERGVLSPPRLLPRCLADEAARERLASIREGLDVVELAEGGARR